MKKGLYPFLFLLCFTCTSNSTCARDVAHLYKIVYVKGKPLRFGKKLIHDGQQIQGKEKIMFTTLEDVVFLLNASFEKIRLFPLGFNQLKKLILLEDFIKSSYSITSKKTNITNVRGGSKSGQFQSISDTLSLHLVNDLKLSLDTELKKLKLFNHFMEAQSGKIKIEGEFLVIFPLQQGVFTLHCENNQEKSEVLAEIEFMDPNELKAELKYVASISPSPDSVYANQLRYIKKTYPNSPDNQVHKIISANK